MNFVPWNVQHFSMMDWKFRIKTALFFFASLGTGIFLGAVCCLHYDINAIIQNRALFSTYAGDQCTPSGVTQTQQEPQAAAIAAQPPNSPTKQINLSHGLSDEELLWQASLIHRRKVVPAHHRMVPKIAFMFLTRGPMPLAPLWEYFFADYRELYSIYVHADPSYSPTTPRKSVFYGSNIRSQTWLKIPTIMRDPQEKLQAISATLDLVGYDHKYYLFKSKILLQLCRGLLFRASMHFCENLNPYLKTLDVQKAQWGTIGIIDAERRLIANALLEPANERFILLSESCIPLYNFSYIYTAFTSIPYSYVQIFDDPGVYGRGRYHPRMMPEVALEQWRKGSQWFEVTRELAVEIVADSKYYRKFSTYCRPHCYVDEHYIQTMLFIEHGAMLMNRTITHTEWVWGAPHPSTFTKASISREFLTSIRSYYFFSRKYAPSALEPLLKLAPEVMFIPTGKHRTSS